MREATLNFFYGTMTAGKSLELIRVAGNMKAKNKDILIFNHSLDNRFWHGKVASRLNLEREAIPYNEKFDFIKYVLSYKKSKYLSTSDIQTIFIDEAQFLTKSQVEGLAEIVAKLNINVFCYGLKTNYKGELFEGAKRLLEIADNISEIESFCWCGKKATMNAKIVDTSTEESDILIGGEDIFTNVCYIHFLEEKYNQ